MTVQNRFHINSQWGFISAHQTRQEAIEEARRYQAIEPDAEIELFDAMARRGQPELWKVEARWVVLKARRPA